MFVEYRGSVTGLVMWQWRAVLLFFLAATAVVLVDRTLDLGPFRLSTFPAVVVGAAIGIFASFRTNSAYDRWWEARKLWGQLVNGSRLWATQVLAYFPAAQGGMPSATQRALVERQVTYAHVLRVLLRKQSLAADPELRRQLSDAELRELEAEPNPTHALLHRQLEVVVAETDAGRIDGFRMQSMQQTIATLLDVQGGCERIKHTPFPRGYGFIAERLIQAYGLLLPLALVAEHGWITIPLSVMVCMAFLLISEVGRVLEDPFTMFWPALPLSAIATTIEIDLRRRLGDTDLPPKPISKEGILM